MSISQFSLRDYYFLLIFARKNHNLLTAMKYLRFVLAFMMAAFLSNAVEAQEKSAKVRNYKPYPHLFVTVQGGTTRTYTSDAVSRKWVPQGAVSLGGYLTSFLGARIQGNGVMWDEDLVAGGTYSNKWLGYSADLLVNLTGIFYPNRNNLLNFVAIAGIGQQHAKFGAKPTSHKYPMNMLGDRWMTVGRLAGQLDLSVSKHFDILFEGGYNMVHDHFNNFKVEKWWPYASVGLGFKFGQRKERLVTPGSNAVMSEFGENSSASSALANPSITEERSKAKPKPEVKPDTVAAVVETPVVKATPTRQRSNVFFRIGRYQVGAAQQQAIQEIVTWAKAHPKAPISLVGYADKGTGSARVNQAISEHRVRSVKNALVRQGIDARRITIDAKGDTVQPFAENDLNRVVVAVSEDQE